MTTTDLPVPAVGDRYISTSADDTGRIVTITRVWDAPNNDDSDGTHAAVAYEWGERGQCGSACPLTVFHRHYRAEGDPDADLSPTLATLPEPPHRPRYTDKQVQILTHLARGNDRAGTAREVGIAVVTLDDYLRRLRARLGAGSTTHLITLAIAAGIIPADVAAGTEVPR